VLVGALLCPPTDPSCAVGVIFFNNVSYLGMCGHGTIGLVATLAYLGLIGPGEHRIETPVGVVTATLLEDGRVSVRNVPAYRQAQALSVVVAGQGGVGGDVAGGGYWLFLTVDHGEALLPERMEELSEVSWRVREALTQRGITGAEDGEIDHIELFAPSPTPRMDARSFVLCPGKAYDRSPCGTGTSAKLACLAADGKLAPGERWVQESIIGSRFEASYTLDGDTVLPEITGAAFITGEGRLILDERDPFRHGIQNG
jgi:4-hydroxyproline epimerase